MARLALLALPLLEAERFKGDGAGLVESKLARLEAILGELEEKGMERFLGEKEADWRKHLKEARQAVENLQKDG